MLKQKTLLKLPEDHLEYLYHYVGAREMIIHLAGKHNYVLYLCADSVAFDWIESQSYMQ